MFSGAVANTHILCVVPIFQFQYSLARAKFFVGKRFIVVRRYPPFPQYSGAKFLAGQPFEPVHGNLLHHQHIHQHVPNEYDAPNQRARTGNDEVYAVFYARRIFLCIQRNARRAYVVLLHQQFNYAGNTGGNSKIYFESRKNIGGDKRKTETAETKKQVPAAYGANAGTAKENAANPRKNR